MQLQTDLENQLRNAQVEKKEYAVSILRTIFTPGQVKKLFNQDRRITWTVEDIRSAIALRAAGSKAYTFLREVMKYPLPSVTIRTWIAHFQLRPGLLHEVLNIMHIKGQDLTILQKLTVLTFDEVYISNKIDIEREQKVYGSHKNCQVIMARVLFSKWKMPIFYNFSTAMNKEILFDAIKNLHKIGYTVIAISCDMCTTNMGLWSELEVRLIKKSKRRTRKTTENDKQYDIHCFFVHPSENLKVFILANAPLIKLLRNNFFDYGFTSDDETISKSILEDLLQLNSEN